MNITIHTFTNNYYACETCYRQFVQHDGQPLLESQAIAGPETLGDWLQDRIEEGDFEATARKFHELEELKQAGKISAFLTLCEELYMKASACEVVAQSGYGEMEYAALVIPLPKTLRQSVDDLWGEEPDYPKQGWKYEVANDDTTLGYFEWVEHQREQKLNTPD